MKASVVMDTWGGVITWVAVPDPGGNFNTLADANVECERLNQEQKREVNITDWIYNPGDTKDTIYE